MLHTSGNLKTAGSQGLVTLPVSGPVFGAAAASSAGNGKYITKGAGEIGI